MNTHDRNLPAAAAAALALLFAALPAPGATYYWKPGAAGGDYGTLSNWSTESASGADAAALPGASDKFAYDGDYALDLGGGSWEIGGWSASGNPGAARTFSVANGTLTNKGDWKPWQMTLTVKDGGTFVHGGGSFLPGQDSWKETVVDVESGGAFRLVNAANPMFLVFNVAPGGAMEFAPTYWGLPNKAVATGATINNEGTLDMLSGWTFNNGGSGAGACYVNQKGGTLNLAGTVDGKSRGSRSGCSLSVAFSGGTVNVAGAASFANLESLTLSGATTWHVASGVSLDLSAAAMPSASVTKTGAGALALPDVPETLRWEEGAMSFAANTRASYGALSLGAGAALALPVANTTVGTLEKLAGSLAISRPGLTIVSVPDGADLSGTVTVDLASFATGGTVVATPSAALRAKVLAAAEAAIAATDAALVASDDGSAVAVAPATAMKVFDSTDVSDLADAAGWRGGDLPAAGEAALVSGAGVVAGLSAAALAKGWTSVVVENGATLRLLVSPGFLPLLLEDGTTLSVASGVSVGPALASAAPALVLEPGATLRVGAGETFAVSSSLATEADASALSRIEVEAGGVLQVPGGFAFKNVALAVDGGSIEFAGTGAVTFGTAAAGETARFSMAASNASIGPAASVSGNHDGLRFACPAAGGAVEVVGEIVLRDTVLDRWYKGFATGENNPADRPFAVVLDNTSLTWYKGALSVAGASSLVVSNGTLVTTSRNNSYNDRLEVSGAGTLVVGEGGTVFYPVANGGNAQASLGGGASGRPALVLAGGTFEPFKTAPNAGSRTIEVSADSTWGVFEDTYWWDGIRNILFDGAAETVVDAGATLTVLNHRYDNWLGGDNTGVWMADAPVNGAGNLAFTNAYAGTAFAVRVRNGSNACTGEIAADPASGSSLVFGDGSNWAGTVVANGAVSLANSRTVETETADPETGETTTASSVVDAPARVSFGTLRLDGNFPIRLWEDGTADAIDFGAGGATGPGALVASPVGGFDPARGGRWVVGSIPDGVAIPSVSPRFFSLRALPPDENGVRTLVLLRDAATVIVIR